MFGYGWSFYPKQYSYLVLCKPDCLAFHFHLQPRHLIRLINYNLTLRRILCSQFNFFHMSTFFDKARHIENAAQINVAN